MSPDPTGSLEAQEREGRARRTGRKRPELSTDSRDRSSSDACGAPLSVLGGLATLDAVAVRLGVIAPLLPRKDRPFDEQPFPTPFEERQR